MPSKASPTMASFDDSTMVASRREDSSACLCAATTAARPRLVIARKPMNACSNNSDSFAEYRANGPKPWSVPHVAMTERMTVVVAASRRSKRYAAHRSAGSTRNSSG